MEQLTRKVKRALDKIGDPRDQIQNHLRHCVANLLLLCETLGYKVKELEEKVFDLQHSEDDSPPEKVEEPTKEEDPEPEKPAKKAPTKKASKKAASKKKDTEE